MSWGKISIFFKVIAIKRCLRKPSPRNISYSNKDDADYDCYTVFLDFGAKPEHQYVVLGISENEFDCVGFDNQQQSYSLPCSFERDLIAKAEIRVIHYYKYLRAEYNGTLNFWVGEISREPRRAHVKDQISQSIYNRTANFRKDRISVLKAITEQHFFDASEGEAFFPNTSSKSIVSLFTDLYGYRAFGHPDRAVEAERLRVIVDSLCISGEIKKLEGGNYVLAPKSIETLSAYELDERRNRQSVIHNWLIFFLTLAIALATILSTYFAWLEKFAN